MRTARTNTVRVVEYDVGENLPFHFFPSLMVIFGSATRKAVTHAAELVLELMILLDKFLNKKKKNKKIERCCL
jgi:hypothetical protein